jgi:DNA-binding MarR family transcriptional regulator
VGAVADDGRGSGPGERVPLARLFAMAFRWLIDELHERLEQRGWPSTPPTFGFVLVAVRDEPATVVSIAGLLGVTKQAASKVVAAMAEAGYVERRPHDADGRAKAIVLTGRGAELLGAVEEIYGELEAEWADVVGARSIDSMRSDLVEVLRSVHGGDLPAIRPTG